MKNSIRTCSAMTTPTKVLDLRGLSATERDARVDEAVAICVAGWHRGERSRGEHPQYWYKGNDIATLGDLPPYATSCDAVRILELAIPKEQRNRYINLLNDIHAEEEIDAVELDFRWCTSSALHRCIALLRANGWEVLT